MAKRNLVKQLNRLRTSDKVQLAVAFFLTAVIVISIPVLAWFAYQRRIATVAKINSPAKLSIKSGYAEDIINFKVSGINVGNGETAGYRDFVFCVEGEDVSSYNLQIARTTNINFNYTLYKAHSVAPGSEIATDVLYEDSNKIDRYYRCFDEFVDNSQSAAYGGYINKNDAITQRNIGTNHYSEKSYELTDSLQRYAEPIYWQTKSPVVAKDTDASGGSFDEYESFYHKVDENKFLNFYVLRVSWNAGAVSNDKETDLIYITAQVN